jgi:hypothetical protein
MNIEKKIKRLQSINIEDVLDLAVRDNEKAMLDLNREQMYEQGVMNVKTEKREIYSPSTVRQKKTAPFNKTSHVTLKWTGEFHESLKLFIFKAFYIISSKDLKWSRWLEPNERFANALGLTEESMGKFRSLVKPSFIRILKKEL